MMERSYSRPGRGRRRRRIPRVLRVLLNAMTMTLTLVGAWFVAATIVFVLPHQQSLRHADAIVTLAPAGSRLPVAEEAFNEGISDALWISYFPDDTSGGSQADAANDACDKRSPHANVTTCFTPRSDDTIGEARMVAELVENSSVNSLIIATNVSHSARAKFLFKKILPSDVEVQMLMVEEQGNFYHIAYRMIYESGAFVKAIIRIGW